MEKDGQIKINLGEWLQNVMIQKITERGRMARQDNWGLKPSEFDIGKIIRKYCKNC